MNSTDWLREWKNPSTPVRYNAHDLAYSMYMIFDQLAGRVDNRGWPTRDAAASEED